MIFIYKN